MIKSLFKILVIFIFGIAGGIFANYSPFLKKHFFNPDQQPIYLNKVEQVTITENIALQEAISKVEKTIVGIKTQTKSGKIIEGSGFILTSDGLMITLGDLIPVGSTFSFFIEGKPLSYQILKRDLNNNLALIKLEGESFNTAGFADFEKLKIGERIFFIGVVDFLKWNQAVNEGIVKEFNNSLIKTNMLDNKKMNGSPVFNIQGMFLGLVSVNKEDIVSVIPVNIIRSFAGM